MDRRKVARIMSISAALFGPGSKKCANQSALPKSSAFLNAAPMRLWRTRFGQLVKIALFESVPSLSFIADVHKTCAAHYTNDDEVIIIPIAAKAVALLPSAPYLICHKRALALPLG